MKILSELHVIEEHCVRLLNMELILRYVVTWEQRHIMQK
jgi:hypothetical protein